MASWMALHPDLEEEDVNENAEPAAQRRRLSLSGSPASTQKVHAAAQSSPTPGTVKDNLHTRVTRILAEHHSEVDDRHILSMPGFLAEHHSEVDGRHILSMPGSLAEHHSEVDDRHILSMPGSSSKTFGDSKDEEEQRATAVAGPKDTIQAKETRTEEEQRATAEVQPKLVEGTLTEAEKRAIASVEAKMGRKAERAQAREAQLLGAGQSSVQASSGDDTCFAGRRPPKDAIKRQAFKSMASTYQTMVAKMRAEGKCADSTASAQLQKDYWTFVKEELGDHYGTEGCDKKIKKAAAMWASKTFHFQA